MSIIVPARDEEQLLPLCLASLARARARLDATVECEVIVASDASVDGTTGLAQQLLAGWGVVTSLDAQCVGAARQAAAALAVERWQGPPEAHWLANTDADCEVSEDWLVRQLQIAQLGWLAVAGVVTVEDFSGHEPEVAQRFHESYAIHADGTHPHVHGANLGIRADVFVQAGGWAALKTAEDHELWARLGRLGVLRLADASLRVLTSGRRAGRAPRGFAEALAAHNRRVA